MVELALLFILVIWQSPPPQKLIAIYDARLSPKPVELSLTDVALARRAARKAWGNQENCDSGFAELDVAYGSFTKAQASQKAILYRNCTTGPYFSSQGIAIAEGDKLVTQIAYDDAWDYAIGTLPDINKNGLSEIILASGGLTQGYSWKSVSIIELSSDGVKKLGNFEAYDDNCGTGEKGKATAHKLYVETGADPVFYRETFKQGCYDQAKWAKSQSVRRIEAGKNEMEYRRLN